ncbi:MAG: hypothetical protein QM775_35105 [Pirellulales bacterium]
MNDFSTLQTIRTQTLALLAEITAQPKPSYVLDGQSVSWESYLAQLRATLDWCDAKLAAGGPIEIISQGST